MMYCHWFGNQCRVIADIADWGWVSGWGCGWGVERGGTATDFQHVSSVSVFVNCTICIPASSWSDRQEIGFLPEASKKRMLIAASTCQDTCRHVGRGTLSWYANTWLCQEKYNCMNETSHLLGLAELWHSPWLVTAYIMFYILFPETQVRDHLDTFSR